MWNRCSNGNGNEAKEPTSDVDAHPAAFAVVVSEGACGTGHPSSPPDVVLSGRVVTRSPPVYEQEARQQMLPTHGVSAMRLEAVRRQPARPCDLRNMELCGLRPPSAPGVVGQASIVEQQQKQHYASSQPRRLPPIGDTVRHGGHPEPPLLTRCFKPQHPQIQPQNEVGTGTGASAGASTIAYRDWDRDQDRTAIRYQHAR